MEDRYAHHEAIPDPSTGVETACEINLLCTWCRNMSNFIGNYLATKLLRANNKRTSASASDSPTT
jgi:hypothetical protein